MLEDDGGLGTRDYSVFPVEFGILRMRELFPRLFKLVGSRSTA